MNNTTFSQALEYYNSGDFQNAYVLWSQMTTSANALYNAGVILISHKIDIENRWNKAYDLFRKAAELGHCKAAYYCGYLLETVFGEKYFDSAVTYYHDAMERGDNEAFGRIQGLANKGNTEAMSLLGWCYLGNSGVKRNDNEAEKWGLKAYNKGDYYNSSWTLACVYRRKKDDEKAFYYYKVASENGNDQAYGPLGDMYRKGEGTKKMYSEALKWYTKGAETGHEDARFILGLMNLKGLGCDPNADYAKLCFDKVVESGDAEKINSVACEYNDSSSDIYNPERALQLLELSSKKGCKHACVNLGIALYYGENITQDYDRAFKLFMQAEENPTAQEYLGLCYYKGHGCRKDKNKAKQYFLSAIRNGNDSPKRYFTSDMELKPDSFFKEKGAEVLGGVAALLVGSFFSAIGYDD